MQTSHFNWKVAGFAGEGIMTTGLLFSKTCARHGWRIFDYTEYPSLIRGGHNTYQVFSSKENAFCQRFKLDILVALNKNALRFHRDELKESSLVIYDQEDDNVDVNLFNLPCKSFNLPMVSLAEKSGAKRVMANNVALGASIFFLGLDLDILENLIADIFSKKGDEVINLNKNAAKAGFNFAKNNSQPLFQIEKQQSSNIITATGNEATGLGSIAGGLQFYVAYPMTPSSSLLHFVAAKAKQQNFVVKHAEDEISAVNMALGASFSGARSMIGTSGGGFCYMTESLGLSGVAELPLVIFEAMRPGPALGMPTWTAQGDLLFAINASQDEFPRFVLTPGNGEEAFNLARKALDLAEKYQTLVIILSDKYLSESRHTIDLKKSVFSNTRNGFSQNPKSDETDFFPRYKISENPINLRSVPGNPGGAYIANSYEHDEYGFTTEDREMRQQQMDKRNKKFLLMKSEVPQQYYESLPDSLLTFISFGSTKCPIQAARYLLTSQGIPSNMLHLSWVWPFPIDQVKSVIDSSKNVIVVEGNSQGQLAKLITQETGIKIENNLRRYDGRPFYPEDIAEHVKNMNLK